MINLGPRIRQLYWQRALALSTGIAGVAAIGAGALYVWTGDTVPVSGEGGGDGDGLIAEMVTDSQLFSCCAGRMYRRCENREAFRFLDFC